LGKYPDAVKFAKEIAEYVNQTYPVELGVFMETDGTIYWMSDYKDYATYGQVRTQIATDQRYWEIVAGAAEVLVDGSITDITLMEI